MTNTSPGKQAVRDRIWDELEERGEARFPFPPHGRIPNFAGAARAASRLTGLDAWESAAILKANPDAPQLPVRRRALQSGRTLYMAVPRLREPDCFVELDPAGIDDTDAAATVSSMGDYGQPVGPETVPEIDLIVVGSVAATPAGARVGKGEGYSDLEYAILQEFGLVSESTPVVTTVHEIQVVTESIPVHAHDVPIDIIVTPDQTLRTDTSYSRPSGVAWDRLSEDRVDEIPVLERLRPECWRKE